MGQPGIGVLALALLSACGAGTGAARPPSLEGTDVTASRVGEVLETELGHAPLCEPSASIRAPWDPDTVIVADNEREDLFTFRIDPHGGLVDQGDLPTPAENKPRDVEALAEFDGGLLVVGSYSRDRRCEERPKRRRLRVVSWDAERGSLVEDAAFGNEDGWADVVGSVESCLDELFQTPGELEHPPDARGVCEALVSAEREGTPESCATLNIEGAVTVSDAGDAGSRRTWLGLRSPLVDDHAVLLRLSAPTPSLRFDAVVLLDLEGLGVRELAASDDVVWGIAGPVDDRAVPFALWRVPVDRLRPGATVNSATRVGDLPTSSEGLVVDGAAVIVTVDGEQEEGDSSTCRRAPAQARVPVRRVMSR